MAYLPGLRDRLREMADAVRDAEDRAITAAKVALRAAADAEAAKESAVPGPPGPKGDPGAPAPLIWGLAQQPANQVVTNSSVLVPSSLSATLLAQTTYRVRGALIFSSPSAGAGFKYRIDGPASPVRVQLEARGTGSMGAIQNALGNNIVVAAATGLAGVIRVDGIVITGANGGPLTISFAQNAAILGGSATLFAGSYLETQAVTPTSEARP